MKILLDMGLYIGIGGSLTFKNSIKPVEAAKQVPPDRFLIETDSPYLAPVPMRGKRNEPSFTHYVAERLAGLRGQTQEEIKRRLWKIPGGCFPKSVMRGAVSGKRTGA